MGFIDVIKERAKAANKTIVLPETEDRRTYEAAAQILKEGIAKIILVGSEEAVKKGSEGLDLTGAVVVDPATSDRTQAYIDKLVELRQKKGMTPEQAKEILLNQYLYYGVMMAADPENKTRYKTGIRILPDGRSELRIRCRRYLYLCRFRSEPEPESGRTGCNRRIFCRFFRTAGRERADRSNAFSFYKRQCKTCRC